MQIIIVLASIVNIVLFIYTAYLTLFSIVGLPFGSRKYPYTDRKHHFAILIAARNEEMDIADLIDSIRRLDYPAESVETYVIVNNCTDHTEDIALRHGAKIISCDVPISTKGDALKYAFNKLKNNNDIDAYVILDADNLVDPGFLKEINKAFASGASAVQCKRTGRNSAVSWIAGCYEIYYAMQNAYYNHPRTKFGLSASINGSGWAVTRGLIDRIGFETYTITEDLEYTIQCALNGEQIAYCSDAVLFDVFVTDLKTSMIQRVRWTFGMMQCMREYEGKLIKSAFHGSHTSADLSFINVMMAAITILLIVLLPSYLCIRTFLSFEVFILMIVVNFFISLIFSSMIAVIKTHVGVRTSIWGILTYPIFILTWVPILISCYFRRDVKWSEIRKN